MGARPGTSPVLAGSAAPLTQARLLAALLAGPMPGEEVDRWVRRNDGVAAVDALLAAGSVRRTAGGGLALDGRRRSAALDALARDLQL
ncbi:hypothetical protein [Cellulomonas endometrii]|jgi:hypothetical protein|uniref:hypothetical protein n=1 Tax=Cellulomonas endometrii TaxID=3036301 RepID=UPI0024AD4976|nr:hypothetical protein [Cellulomonas endometrii]